MKWKALTGFFVTCAIAFGAYSACSLLRRPENNPSQWMSGVVVSRLGVAHVQAFLDDSQIHGLKFFFFKIENSTTFINFLGLQPRVEVPDIFKSRLDDAKSKVDWKFNWSRSKAYSIYYCNGLGQDWSVDLVLVDGNDVVYMTSGYSSQSTIKVHDYDACHSKA